MSYSTSFHSLSSSRSFSANASNSVEYKPIIVLLPLSNAHNPSRVFQTEITAYRLPQPDEECGRIQTHVRAFGSTESLRLRDPSELDRRSRNALIWTVPSEPSVRVLVVVSRSLLVPSPTARTYLTSETIPVLLYVDDDNVPDSVTLRTGLIHLSTRPFHYPNRRKNSYRYSALGEVG